jgi:hypothetical protein
MLLHILHQLIPFAAGKRCVDFIRNQFLCYTNVSNVQVSPNLPATMQTDLGDISTEEQPAFLSRMVLFFLRDMFRKPETAILALL